MADKRIIELANEKLVLADGDMTIVDSENGTYKYDLNRLAKKTITDTTLSVEGKPADAKAVGDALASVDVDTVNNARQLLSENYVLDQEPYLSRASGGDGADRVEECIVGGSVAWNQLQNSPTYLSGSVAGITASVSDGVITITGTATETGNISVNPNASASVPANHVLLITATGKGDVQLGRKGFSAEANYNYAFHKHTSDFYCDVFFYIVRGKTYDCEKRINVFDLTTLFGSTIADYIYSLEQANAGDGVAWFRKYFPEDYYEYSAPTLKHVEGVSAKQIRDSDDNVTAIYPLDSTLTLRGIPKLTDGKVYFDGDKYNADGTVQPRVVEVDLTALTYTTRTTGSTNKLLSAFLPHVYACRWSALQDCVCDTYDQNAPDSAAGLIENIESCATGLYFLKKAEGRTDSIIYLVINKNATPQGKLVYLPSVVLPTETATPYTAIQLLDPHGTEEFVSTGIVPVGHESRYLENLRSKIEGLPRDFSTLIAPTEKEYKATQNYTVGSLLIVNNILYKVTSAIANGGNITPNTNCTATTLAAVIAALA